jgi:hypothetical protein
MGRKKKRKAIEQRRAQAKGKKRRKPQAKSPRPKPKVQHMYRPALSDIEAPEGFRAVSMSQAMMEYTKPLLQYVKGDSFEELNEVMQLAMPIWNYSLQSSRPEHKEKKEAIINHIGKTLKMNEQESTELFEMMVHRKEYLIPQQIQPKIPQIMFVRKEEQFLIPEFDYGSLHLSEEDYTPDGEDKKLLQMLNKMDKYVVDGVAYDEWEDYYISFEEKCREGFEKWLACRGVKNYSEDFSGNITSYMDFIYRYIHEDVVILRSVQPVYVIEYFTDHLLRKVMVDPPEYIKWTPSLKLFYRYLHEIGYVDEPEKFIVMFDEIEPHFTEILRKRYS